MEYVALIFGFFGFLAYVQISSLKGRIKEIENQLAGMKGTSFHEKRKAFREAASAYIGEEVNIDFKEDYEDTDVIMYGNTKHGSVVIMDLDDDWMLLQITTPKGVRNKLIRLEAINNISRTA